VLQLLQLTHLKVSVLVILKHIPEHKGVKD